MTSISTESLNHVSETDTLFDLIEMKLHLLTEMQRMSISQSDIVSQHDVSGLMALLSRKQELMNSLHQVQADLLPFQNQDPESRIWSTPEKRRTCQEQIVDCDRILAELIVMENRSLDHMNLQRDATFAQLQQNIDASTVQHAYQATLADEYSESTLSFEG